MDFEVVPVLVESVGQRAEAGIAAAPTFESLVDFSKLPPSALDKYIDHYQLVERYPPYPSKRRKRSQTPSSENEGSLAGGEEDAGGRVSKRIDSNQTITTSTRLRPRSPNASTAQYFAGGGSGKRNNNAEDDFEGGPGAAGAAGGEANGKNWDMACPTHFFDAQEADHYLATVASRHFASQPPPKEGEVVVQFLYRCRAGGESLFRGLKALY